MKTAFASSFSDFQVKVQTKNLLPQFVEYSDRYELFAIEDNISWEFIIYKDGGDDQLAFEKTAAALYNQPLEFRSVDGLPKFASAMFVDNLGYWVDGSNGVLTTSSGQTGYIKTHFTDPFRLNGVDIHWANSNFGDYINFEVGVYSNNDTSSEDNFTQLAQFANQYRVLNEGTKTFIVDTVKTVPPSMIISPESGELDVYIRTTYVNVGQNSANICVNLIGYI